MPDSLSMSSAQHNARSPSRIAADSPKRSEEPDQFALRCRSANATCTVGKPRRVTEASMMSSWINAHAWTSSSAEQARTIDAAPSLVLLPPAPSQAVQANAGRTRLPPRRTNSVSSRTAVT